jgi:hypothetical protein
MAITSSRSSMAQIPKFFGKASKVGVAASAVNARGLRDVRKRKGLFCAGNRAKKI